MAPFRIPPHIRRSLTRSRIRTASLDAIERDGPGYPSEIARRIGSSPANVVSAILGDRKDYRHDRSLLQLGLLVHADDHEGGPFDITPWGRRVIREWRRLSAARPHLR